MVGFVGVLLNDLLKEKKINMSLVEIMSDAISVLTDLQHDGNVIRRNLIVANLSNNFGETLREASPDEFLFRKRLDERLKARDLN